MKSKYILGLVIAIGISSAHLVYGQSDPFRGLRGRINYVPDSLTGFHGTLGTRGLNTFRIDAYRLKFRPNPSASALRANIGGGLGSGKYSSRSTALNFANPSLRVMQTPVSNGAYKFGLTSGINSNINMNAPSEINTALPAVSLPYGGGLNSIVLIPDTDDICQTDKLACMISSQEALKPFMGKKLLRPNLDMPLPKNKNKSIEEHTADEFLTSDNMGDNISQSSVYVAQQFSQARNYMRKKQYSEALTCYQAANSIDAKNENAIIGTIYSHIMCGKLQAGGEAVLRLARLNSHFWKERPDFIAIFGMPAVTIVDWSSQAEPDIDYYISLCKGDNTKIARRGLKLAYLAKMFLAWLADNDKLMKQYITSAAKAAPYDPVVQRLYRDITGKKQQRELQLKTIKPLG